MKVLKERDVPVETRISKPAPVERAPPPAAEDKVIAAIDRLMLAVQALNKPDQSDPPDGSVDALKSISEQLAELIQCMRETHVREPAQPVPQVRGYHFDVTCDTLGNITTVEATRVMDS